MAIYALGDRVPKIDPAAFVHPDAVVIGDVVIEEETSIWPNAVLRGDYGHIEIGARTSIQDGSVVHATAELATIVGSDCVVGHIVHLEGCTIEPHALVGSGSVVLHRAIVRSHALVGANAVVPNDMEVPSHAMALGIPAKLREGAVREGSFRMAVAGYVQNAKRYKAELRRLD
ncbi:MAG TPA: gamma carbonic anhydrase family protein [Acidimicrobiales bacterium]|jgi:carbonic anhydrase/acetyltransferase-like protein (isoleucine patch superfamily)|nr:gamma carbonic anhydrase family protein [Acidimicrobiales bacterium]